MEPGLLELDKLVKDYRPGITPHLGGVMKECAAVCLDSHQHEDGVLLSVSGRFKNKYSIRFGNVNDQMRQAHGDNEVATENGAYGIAILIIDENTGLTVTERSRKGTGFDFWLGDKSSRGPYFQNKARLEVSGIRSGTDSSVKSRMLKKLKQTERSDGVLPAYVAIVEFRSPKVKVVEK